MSYANSSIFIRRRILTACLVMLSTSAGCHVLSPKPIAMDRQHVASELLQSNGDPIEIGRPIKWLDAAGWVCGIPSKILLWDRRIDNHNITAQTIATTEDYLHANQLAHVKVRMNQYAPLKDFDRLKKNTTVAWPYRYTLGLLSVGQEMILPGRLFGGDHFNPYTQTIHLYSDAPAIALHELGHAKDFARREFQGTYALAYAIFPMIHEAYASQDALAYLYERNDRDGIIEANRLLYPAYGTYLGSSLGTFSPAHAMPIYYGATLAGHLNGRLLSHQVDQSLDEYAILYPPAATHDEHFSSPPPPEIASSMPAEAPASAADDTSSPEIVLTAALEESLAP